MPDRLPKGKIKMARNVQVSSDTLSALRAFVKANGSTAGRGRFKTSAWIDFLSQPENRQHTRALAAATGVKFNGRVRNDSYSKSDIAAVQEIALAVR